MPPKVVRIDSLLKQTKSTASSITKTRSKGKAAVKQTLADQLAALPHSASPKPIIKQENQQGQEGQSLQTAMDHLCSVDPRFRILFQRFTPQPWTETGLAERKDHFKSLVLSVLSQQVSGAAARAIGRRFIGLFTDVSNAAKVEVDMDPEVEDGPPRLSAITSIKVEQETSSLANSAPANEDLEGSFFPSPEQVAASDVLYIKSAGASLRKAEYVHGIANSFVSGELTDEFFNTADDESIKKKLISIRGLGPWSAEMFMMFSLKRWDIVSPGDIGIQRGMSWWTGKNPLDKSKHNKNKASKYFSETEMLDASEAWRPYRSIGCWAMWRVDCAYENTDAGPSSIEQGAFAQLQ